MQGPALAAAVFVLSLATFIVILDTTIINVAVPHIAGAFAASANEGTWAITSYAVAEAFTVPLSGWLVTRFGFSLAGAVLQASSDGNTVAAIAGLDVKRRRIGLTVAPDGTVFDGWFTVVGTGPPMMGTVSRVALDGSGETDLVTGIGKPVGLLALGSQLYISDEANGVILQTPLAVRSELFRTLVE